MPSPRLRAPAFIAGVDWGGGTPPNGYRRRSRAGGGRSTSPGDRSAPECEGNSLRRVSLRGRGPANGTGAGFAQRGGWRPLPGIGRRRSALGGGPEAPPTYGVPVRPSRAPGVLRPSGWGGPGARLGFDMGVESFRPKRCARAACPPGPRFVGGRWGVLGGWVEPATELGVCYESAESGHSPDQAGK